MHVRELFNVLTQIEARQQLSPLTVSETIRIFRTDVEVTYHNQLAAEGGQMV